MLFEGTLSAHMAQHIVLMSGVAPLLAYVLRRASFTPGSIGAATALQIVLIWAWHSPPAMALMHILPVHLFAQLTLLLAATWFWAAVFAIGGNQRWQPILALLVTSKLFCLLGVLLVFAPRPLFATLGHHGSIDLADQQLAGLLMIVACPLTYLLAGVICAARWFGELEGQSSPGGAPLTDG
jgi:putative membrane protein